MSKEAAAILALGLVGLAGALVYFAVRVEKTQRTVDQIAGPLGGILDRFVGGVG